jgi:hypothetical protein
MLRPTASRQDCRHVRFTYGCHNQIFITVKQLRVCWCGTPSLTRRRIFSLLQLLLILATLQSFSDPSPAVRDNPNLEGLLPVFISSKNRVAQLYSPVLGCTLFNNLSAYDFPARIAKKRHTLLLRHSDHTEKTVPMFCCDISNDFLAKAVVYTTIIQQRWWYNCCAAVA